MNGRLKRDGDGKPERQKSNWGQTRFLSFERTWASLVRDTLMLRRPRAFERGATQRERTARGQHWRIARSRGRRLRGNGENRV